MTAHESGRYRSSRKPRCRASVDLAADAENHIAEAKKLLGEAFNPAQITFDAKGKIMDGEDPKAVLEWVLTQVSGEEIVL